MNKEATGHRDSAAHRHQGRHRHDGHPHPPHPSDGEADQTLALANDLLAAGKIGPNIMERFPFERFMAAIELLEARKVVGKSVLLM